MLLNQGIVEIKGRVESLLNSSRKWNRCHGPEHRPVQWCLWFDVPGSSKQLLSVDGKHVVVPANTIPAKSAKVPDGFG